MLSWVCLALSLTTGAVAVDVEAIEGLEGAERQALLAEVDNAIVTVTGMAPSPEYPIHLAVRARRVGWRVQIVLERRSGSQRVAGETVDLTRDPRSWRAPLTDVVKRILPEGRALAQLLPAKKPAPPIAVAPPPPAAAPPRAATLVPPIALPDPPALTPDTQPLFQPAPPGRSKIFPILAMAAGIAATAAGVKFVLNASDAIDAAAFSTDQDVIEAQQRAVFENAVIGSVLLSAGSAAIITGLILTISD